MMGCAWVNPDTDCTTEGRYKAVDQNAHSKEDGMPKSEVITRDSLCLATGDLKCRLDTSFLYLPLIPVEFNKNTESKTCQPHC
eukprot:13768318-Ditylum_brightwellii.AAC.1